MLDCEAYKAYFKMPFLPKRTEQTSSSESDKVTRVKNRAESGIADEMFRISTWCNFGDEGLKKDHES